MSRSGDYEYTVSGGYATITGYTGAGGDITIPTTIDGYMVTIIGVDAFGGNPSLTGVTIPDTVISIGGAAFIECSKLSSLSIPNSVTSIGNGAFALCDSLTSVTIPDSVTSLGDSAFTDCAGLTSVSIPNSVTSIGKNTFQGCDSLTSVTIPDSVTFLGKAAFLNCDSLASVAIPNSVDYIDDFAFNSCYRLTATYFFGNAPIMGVDPFSYTGPDFEIYYLNEKTGYSNPWYGYSTEPFYMVAYDGNGNNSGTTPVDSNPYRLGDNVTVAGNPGALAKTDYAFAGWNTQADGTGITYMPGQLFPMPSANVMLYAVYTDEYTFEVIGLKAIIRIYTGPGGNITIPGILDVYTVIGIGANIFEGQSLTGVTIPGTVIGIEDLAFSFCSDLTSVAIPNRVTDIGDNAFKGCGRLTAAYFFGDAPVYMGNTVFEGTSHDFKVYYLFGKTGYSNPWYGYPTEPFYSVTYNGNGNNRGNPPVDNNPYKHGENVTVPGNSGSLSKPDNAFVGWNTRADGTGTTYLPGQTYVMTYAYVILYAVYTSYYTYTVTGTYATITKYTGPGGNVIIPAMLDGYTVTSIGNYAFYNCASITGLTIPNSITSLGIFSFANCSGLSALVIPDSLTSITNYAFAYCTKLTSLTIPDIVTNIGEYAFAYCANLPAVTIPPSVTCLASHVFAYCTSLPDITIPGSVTSIGEYAFTYCTSLPSVMIPGSITSIGKGAFQSCASLAAAHFAGNAPAMGPVVFLGTSLNFKVYYNIGATGFTNLWYGYTTVPLPS